MEETLYAAISTIIDAENWPPPPEVIAEHLEYMSATEKTGRLFAAGPFVDENGSNPTDGLIVLSAPDLRAAEDTLAEDPFHRDGYRSFEASRWQLHQGRVTKSPPGEGP